MDLAGLQIEPEDTSTSQTFPGEWRCYSRSFLSPEIGSSLHGCLRHLSSLSSFAWFFIDALLCQACLPPRSASKPSERSCDLTEVQPQHSGAFLSLLLQAL